MTYQLPQNASKPVDAILVLGGSIQREIYAAQLSNRYPDVPILISRGSTDGCIQQIFLRLQARRKNIWLEKCATSTFENFFFSVPIIRHWGTHKVKVITSPTHLPRAQWMAEIQLGAQGIAVEMDLAKEKGIPGNRESKAKTTLDLTRSLLWAVFAQVISPPCSDVIELINVNLGDSTPQRSRCEHNQDFLFK